MERDEDGRDDRHEEHGDVERGCGAGLAAVARLAEDVGDLHVDADLREGDTGGEQASERVRVK